jgi:hypothetical protein
MKEVFASAAPNIMGSSDRARRIACASWSSDSAHFQLGLSVIAMSDNVSRGRLAQSVVWEPRTKAEQGQKGVANMHMFGGLPVKRLY